MFECCVAKDDIETALKFLWKALSQVDFEVSDTGGVRQSMVAGKVAEKVAGGGREVVAIAIALFVAIIPSGDIDDIALESGRQSSEYAI